LYFVYNSKTEFKNKKLTKLRPGTNNKNIV